MEEFEPGSRGDYVYASIKREAGSGPVRINERMSIRDDLYSLLFVTTLHAEYIWHCDK